MFTCLVLQSAKTVGKKKLCRILLQVCILAEDKKIHMLASPYLMF